MEVDSGNRPESQAQEGRKVESSHLGGAPSLAHCRGVQSILAKYPGARTSGFMSAVAEMVAGAAGPICAVCGDGEFAECGHNAPRLMTRREVNELTGIHTFNIVPDAFTVEPGSPEQPPRIVAYEVVVTHDLPRHKRVKYAEIFGVLDSEVGDGSLGLVVVDQVGRELAVDVAGWWLLDVIDDAAITEERLAEIRALMGISPFREDRAGC